MARIKLGTIASLRVAAYAIGKFPAGALSDHLGGRRNFLAGMFGSALCVLLFALSDGLPLFTLAWAAISWFSLWAGPGWSRCPRAGSLITAMAR